MNEFFWKNKKVFITGHTGFKGGWLSLWLQSLGSQVKGYALKPKESNSLFYCADVSQGIASEFGDIRDYQKLKNSIDSFQPDIVFHLASQPIVRLSYVDPVETYSTNVMGAVHLFESIKNIKSVKAVINITSDKCYENKEWSWGYRENDRLGGYDPYSNSKGCSELVTDCYRKSFFNGLSNHCAIASARAGNIIGGGDWSKDRVIPDAMLSFYRNKPLEIRSPKSIRPWQYILDALFGYLILAEKLYEHQQEFAEAWNFGSNDNDAKSVDYLIEQLSRLWGQASWCVSEKEHPYEATYLKLDCSKAKKRLNWSPLFNLETSLSKTVSWYRSYFEQENIRQITLNEINAYSQNFK